MRIACIIMTIIFACFAYVQLNDLDQYQTESWYVWVGLYVISSLLSLVSCKFTIPPQFLVSLSLSTLVASIVRFQFVDSGSGVLFNENNPAGNEAGGLLVVAIWFGVLSTKSLFSKKA